MTLSVHVLGRQWQSAPSLALVGLIWHDQGKERRRRDQVWHRKKQPRFVPRRRISTNFNPRFSSIWTTPNHRSSTRNIWRTRFKAIVIMSGKFELKQKVELDPPKDDPISLDYLSKCDGMLTTRLSLVELILTTHMKEHMRDIQHTWLSKSADAQGWYSHLDNWHVIGNCFRCDRQQSIWTRSFILG